VVARVRGLVLDSAGALPESFWAEVPVDPARSLAQLLYLEGDARFQTWYQAMEVDGRVAAVLPAYAPLCEEMPDPLYDPAGVFGAGTASDTAWVLLGGRSHVSSAPLISRALAPEAAGAVVADLVAAACERAAGLKRRTAMLYVDADDGGLIGALAATGHEEQRVLAQRWVIEDVGRDLAGYLGGLSRGRRWSVRRDLTTISELGVTASVAGWDDLIGEAAELVAGTVRRHGGDEDPDLVEYRLERWLADGQLLPVAFEIRSGDGALVGASFAWRYDDAVDVYEVGIRDDIGDVRGLCYRELLVYAPLRYAWKLGVRRLKLGLASGETKRLCGATGTDVIGFSRGA
jgi:hypothetical protein